MTTNIEWHTKKIFEAHKKILGLMSKVEFHITEIERLESVKRRTRLIKERGEHK